MHQLPEPSRPSTLCCGCARDTTNPYYYYYEWSTWLTFCDACAQWVSEGFTPACAIVEAREIIHQHQMQIGGVR